MNHLEQLVSEWLQHNRYFVRTGIQVGPRKNGGYEGELDVVALNLERRHLLHIECSLDSLSGEAREKKFLQKFARGKKYIHSVFGEIDLPEPEQIALLQYASSNTTKLLGGARLVTVREFIREIFDGLRGRPSSGAISSDYPLLRTLQLAEDAQQVRSNPTQRIVQAR
jgi:hypothetical protein